jgi:hypothetical protein
MRALAIPMGKTGNGFRRREEIPQKEDAQYQKCRYIQRKFLCDEEYEGKDD